jgi:hypothetical protein
MITSRYCKIFRHQKINYAKNSLPIKVKPFNILTNVVKVIFLRKTKEYLAINLEIFIEHELF